MFAKVLCSRCNKLSKTIERTYMVAYRKSVPVWRTVQSANNVEISGKCCTVFEIKPRWHSLHQRSPGEKALLLRVVVPWCLECGINWLHGPRTMFLMESSQHVPGPAHSSTSSNWLRTFLKVFRRSHFGYFWKSRNSRSQTRDWCRGIPPTLAQLERDLRKMYQERKLVNGVSNLEVLLSSIYLFMASIDLPSHKIKIRHILKVWLGDLYFKTSSPPLRNLSLM